MPTINVEIMQKVLQEFAEKEALTGEEIKVIEQQILELEARIKTCRERLQYLNEDKDRLAAMMSRYTGGANTQVLKRSGTKLKAMPKIADRPQSVDQPQSKEEKNTSSSSTETVDLPKSSVVQDLERAAQTAAQQDVGHTETDSKEAAVGGDDAIKSINDALKGLFRK